MKTDRRQFIKGAALGAGSVVLAPLLAQIRAHAEGDAKLPKRFVFVVEGNGLPWQQIQPIGIERGKNNDDRNKIVETSLDGHDLPKALEPLAPWKNRVTVVQGLSGKICGGGHSNNFGALGCYSAHGGVGNAGAPAAETIDVALGKKLGGVFPQVGLGISDRPEHSIIYNCSAWDAGKPMPTQCRPDLAYASLFGSVAVGQGRHCLLYTSPSPRD